MYKEHKKFYIKKSSLHGNGLFASKNIKKKETIFLIKGKEVNFLITNKESADKINFDIFGISKNKWIDPEDRSWLYFNHSCNPNTCIKGRVTIVALRDIKRGEELTFDYSLNEADIFWNFKCNCGSKNCRKVIKSIQFLPKEVFVRDKFYVPKYFKMVYDKYHYTNFSDKRELERAWIDFLNDKKNVWIKKK